MVKSINDLKKQIKPEIKAAANKKSAQMIAQMSLAEMRKSRGENQSTVASIMDIAQPNISKIESRPDTLVSTLSHYVEALGGKLEIYASFSDGQKIEISQFSSPK